MTEKKEITAQITFTLNEANALLVLLNDITKNGGLSVAETAVYFYKKLQLAFPKSESENNSENSEDKPKKK